MSNRTRDVLYQQEDQSVELTDRQAVCLVRISEATLEIAMSARLIRTKQMSASVYLHTRSKFQQREALRRLSVGTKAAQVPNRDGVFALFSQLRCMHYIAQANAR